MTPAAAPAAPLAPRRRRVAPPRPRRVSGPVRAPQRTAPARRAVNEGGGLVLGLLGVLERISSHRLLDRLIRGRLWIGLVAFALIGIVTLQLGLLQLNSGIGRSLERETALQRENAALSIENSELAGGSRVESQAERLGMQLTAVGGLKFHDSHARSDVPHAAAALKEAPKPAEPPAETIASSSEAESEASTTTGGAGATQGGEASSESAPAEATGGTSEPAPTTAPSGGESSESAAAGAPAAAEPPGAAGGGTAAPGG